MWKIETFKKGTVSVMLKLGINGESKINKKIKQARLAFKNHKMKVIGLGHWRIWNPKSPCNLWVDIVVMGNCGLSVWGDIDGCIFSYYSNPKSPEELVHWIGDDCSLNYVWEKANIGMSSSKLTTCYDDDVAIYDLNERLKQAKNEYGEMWDDTSIGDKYTEAVESAINSISDVVSLESVKNSLYDTISEIDQDCWEWLGSIGRIPSDRLIYAVSAVQRLSQILIDIGDNKNTEKGV